MNEVLYACRFVQFAAAMVIFGANSFQFYALGGGDASAAPSILTEFDAWLGRMALAAAVVALVSALALLLCQAAAMAGSPAAATDPATVTAVLFETRFGRVWLWHLLLAIFLVSACLGRRRKRRAIVLILSLLLLASLGWIGHAAMDEGPTRIAHELNQSVHLLAAGLWLGGLVPLGWLLRRARAPQDVAGITLTTDAIRRSERSARRRRSPFVRNGAINSLLLVGSFEGLVGTPYGRLLGLKILLFSVMVGLALINRFRLLPRLRHEPRFQGISLSLTVPNEAEADRRFTALADGGQVQMPLTKTFFSPRFGMVADRFGVTWMVIVEHQEGT
jgi:copper resistance protein D